MMLELISQDQQPWARLKSLALDGVTSPHSKRAYATALDTFLHWYWADACPPLCKAVVNAYKAHLEAAGLSSSSINLRLTAIRKLIAEAADNGLISAEVAAGVAKVKGAARHRTRVGNWLDHQQAQNLLHAPDPATLTGKRDRALLAVLLGCGLRRSEVAALTFAQLQRREGRWVIVDLLGKHGRIRSVPMSGWTKSAIDKWSATAGIHSGRVFRSLNKAGRLTHGSVTAKVIWLVVRNYRAVTGAPNLAPHDLRRTFAKLAHKGGAPVEQIQISLGHASIQTTELYYVRTVDMCSR